MGSMANVIFERRVMLIIPLGIFVVVNPIEEYFYRFGVAPNLDKS